ncbi:hypothetical protein Dsin_009808 [Dipteronia sinensis]|uniref:Pentatricopeptide repeat-containing protein n=1 Tax=Dipteronia sinensis TaxID=43782 RepID=A0AAE0ARN5_9ROSI|nr:hypothetical protein Dsin_009808 [Dipteronia sinensis]
MLVTSSVEPQRSIYPSVFKAYAQKGMANFGAQLHGRVIKLGIQFDRFIRNSIIYMYANCGFLSEARRVFDHEDMEFDLVAWNSMIMGLAKCGEIDQNGKFKEALELFGEMQKHKIRPSEFTMVSLLNACAKLGAIRRGEWLHAFLSKNNFDLNSIVVTAIIDMYCKCGCPVKALQVFESVLKKGLSCWIVCKGSQLVGSMEMLICLSRQRSI